MWPAYVQWLSTDGHGGLGIGRVFWGTGAVGLVNLLPRLLTFCNLELLILLDVI